MRTLFATLLVLLPLAAALGTPTVCPAAIPTGAAVWRHVSFGQSSGADEGRFVLNDATSYEAWWDAQLSGVAPTVDFAVEFVAALVDAHPTGQAHRLVLAVVTAGPSDFVLQSAGASMEGDLTVEARPYDVVAICRNAPAAPRVMFDPVEV